MSGLTSVTMHSPDKWHTNATYTVTGESAGVSRFEKCFKNGTVDLINSVSVNDSGATLYIDFACDISKPSVAAIALSTEWSGAVACRASQGTLTINVTATVPYYASDWSCTNISDEEQNIKDIFTYSLLSDNTYSITGLKNNQIEEITIPESIDGIPVTQIAANAFSGNTNIKKVIIADSVVKIGDYAFRECGLTNIDLGKGVTSIGEGAFYYSNLKSVTIPANVKNIEIYAFMTSYLSEAKFEITEGWYTYWYGEKRDVPYTFDDTSIAAAHLANEHYPFYHD
ncbi:MAG: leucine-rich repeat domain-containing protein [Clostridia bacterium]|nr:leucine-rich repeat domain-containing protein [Clostridia bacterium]